MSELSSHINIGKVSEKLLVRVGITSFEKLQTAGSKKAFLKIREIDSGACLNLLYALEGAILNIKDINLPVERKEELKKFFKSLKIK
jgi:TfoX C-terminal domain.